MDLEKALRARLFADATLAGELTTPATASDPERKRVYWVDRPQGRPLPDVTLQIIGEERAQHLKGFQATQRGRLQVDIRAADYATARALREKIIEVLTPRGVQDDVRFHRATIPFRRDGDERPESGGIIHRHIIHFYLTYSPA